jgi:hypothetical protein
VGEAEEGRDAGVSAHDEEEVVEGTENRTELPTEEETTVEADEVAEVAVAELSV